MKNFLTGWFLVLSGIISVVLAVALAMYVISTYVPPQFYGPLFFTFIVTAAFCPFYPDLGKAFYRWKEAR